MILYSDIIDYMILRNGLPMQSPDQLGEYFLATVGKKIHPLIVTSNILYSPGKRPSISINVHSTRKTTRKTSLPVFLAHPCCVHTVHRRGPFSWPACGICDMFPLLGRQAKEMTSRSIQYLFRNAQRIQDPESRMENQNDKNLFSPRSYWQTTGLRQPPRRHSRHF